MSEAVNWLLRWLPVISILLSIWFLVKRDTAMALALAVLAVALVMVR